MLKISLCFYLAAVVLVIIAGVVLWAIADAAGAIHNIEKFMGKILSSKNYHLVSAQILEGSVLVGLVLGALDDDPDASSAPRSTTCSPSWSAASRSPSSRRTTARSTTRQRPGPSEGPLVTCPLPHGAIAQPVRARP